MDHTATPWKLRKHESLPSFIEGPKSPTMPYALEVMGDDYTGYGDEEQREADAATQKEGIHPPSVGHGQVSRRQDAAHEGEGETRLMWRLVARIGLWAVRMLLRITFVRHDARRAEAVAINLRWRIFRNTEWIEQSNDLWACYRMAWWNRQLGKLESWVMEKQRDQDREVDTGGGSRGTEAPHESV